MAEQSKILLLEGVRLDRVSLTTPYVGKDAKPNPKTGKVEGKYHADLIMDDTYPKLPDIKAAMRDAIVRKFGDQAAVVLEQIAGNNKLALHRGNVDRPGKPQYKDKLYLSASNNEQPNIVVTENGVNIATIGTPIVLTPAHPLYPYPGCYANVFVSFFAYDYQENGRSVSKGVSCTLMGVQFARHGERLKSAQIVGASEFGLVASDADAPAPAATASTGGAGLI
jgi:hypothetical protein